MFGNVLTILTRRVSILKKTRYFYFQSRQPGYLWRILSNYSIHKSRTGVESITKVLLKYAGIIGWITLYSMFNDCIEVIGLFISLFISIERFYKQNKGYNHIELCVAYSHRYDYRFLVFLELCGILYMLSGFIWRPFDLSARFNIFYFIFFNISYLDMDISIRTYFVLLFVWFLCL